jgi:two-component system chemotaxis sensor kinase CheA
MSIDMSQFYGVFYEESHEHLDEMEHLLMELSLDDPDLEELNSIFRAAHSIKGGSGVFGFDALTGLTHVMENILDLARKSELALTKKIVDQLLITVDSLNQILTCYQNEDEIDWDAIDKGVKALEGLLTDENSEAKTDASDDGFGFYEDPVVESEEKDFGFFESSDAKETESTEDSFGFLTEDDSEVTSNDVTEQDSDQAKSEIENEEDSFGFFEEVGAKNDTPTTEQDAKIEEALAKPSSALELPPKETPANKREIKAKADTKKPAKLTTKKKAKTDAKESGSIRVDTLKIDSLVNLVGELVITQSMIKIVGKDVHGETEEQLDGAINELSRNIREIQEAVMSMRMLPMSFAFNRFPRVVRDLADKLGKEVELSIVGGSTEIDKGLIEKLVDPLTHLIRNSIDHGVETPDIRKLAGKTAKGNVELGAEQRGGNIIITITDDGAGLNRERILEKAMSSGLDVSEDMPDEKVWPLIFEAGFSTAEAVTDVSGRGVGMDVVRRNIESIGGLVEIESRENEGSVFRIRLPLTLAIVDGMCVSVSNQTFVVPLTNIIESMQPTQDQLKTMQNEHLLWVRGEYWPIVPLHQMMTIEGALTNPTEAIVVLVETSRKRFGILVDALEGQQQVVIKSLEQHYKKVRGVAGATIMGDGSVAMILDVESIATNVKNHAPQEVSIAS